MERRALGFRKCYHAVFESTADGHILQSVQHRQGHAQDHWSLLRLGTAGGKSDIQWGLVALVMRCLRQVVVIGDRRQPQRCCDGFERLAFNKHERLGGYSQHDFLISRGIRNDRHVCELCSPPTSRCRCRCCCWVHGTLRSFEGYQR